MKFQKLYTDSEVLLPLRLPDLMLLKSGDRCTRLVKQISDDTNYSDSKIFLK